MTYHLLALNLSLSRILRSSEVTLRERKEWRRGGEERGESRGGRGEERRGGRGGGKRKMGINAHHRDKQLSLLPLCNAH